MSICPDCRHWRKNAKHRYDRRYLRKFPLPFTGAVPPVPSTFETTPTLSIYRKLGGVDDMKLLSDRDELVPDPILNLHFHAIYSGP